MNVQLQTSDCFSVGEHYYRIAMGSSKPIVETFAYTGAKHRPTCPGLATTLWPVFRPVAPDENIYGACSVIPAPKKTQVYTSLTTATSQMLDRQTLLLSLFLFRRPELRRHTIRSNLNRDELPPGTGDTIGTSDCVVAKSFRELTRVTSDSALEGVQLRYPPAEEDLCVLAHCPRLRGLIAPYRSVAESTIDLWKCLPQLELLCLQGARLSDLSLRAILKLDQLQVVMLDRVTVGRRMLDISAIACKDVISLHLGETFLSDRTSNWLAALERLVHIDLSFTGIGDSTCHTLATLKWLQFVDVRYTATTDAALKSLSQLPRLKVLCIDGCDVTDAGLDILTHAKSLQSISVRRTRVTRGGVARFIRSRPECSIVLHSDTW